MTARQAVMLPLAAVEAVIGRAFAIGPDAARVAVCVNRIGMNAMGNGTGWCSLDNWRNVIVPWILKECVPRAAGGWYLTHAIEVHR